MCVVHREQAAEVCVAFIISRAWYQTSMEGSCSFETSSHMCPARQQDGGMVVIVLLPPLKVENCQTVAKLWRPSPLPGRDADRNDHFSGGGGWVRVHQGILKSSDVDVTNA